VSAGPSRAADETRGLTAAFRAVRARLGAVIVLLVVAGVCWWWAAVQMTGMDGGPWTPLGSPGWFLGAWTVMMAAMMFPSAAPTIALYSRMTSKRRPLLPVLFTSGYLLVWAAAGALALVIAAVAGAVGDGLFAWDHAGRPLTVATLLFAAIYEFTPWKNVCLGKCRNPLSFLLGTWRDGWRGATLMGVKLGAWCLGCCWALMAAMFALGVMNIVWMASVAVLIALEKLLPWRRAATYVTAAVLVGLALVALLVPQAIPGTMIAPTMPMSETGLIAATIAV
jgi:predicted metal-binding membrane protein